MKALELETGLILKEKNRYIDRELNSITFVFSVKIKYGTVVTAELAPKERILQVDINKSESSKLWKFMKDITFENLMIFILQNKDFIHLQIDGKRTDENETEFRYLEPFYNTLFIYLQQFDEIKIIEI